jgi:hypothetical protein
MGKTPKGSHFAKQTELAVATLVTVIYLHRFFSRVSRAISQTPESNLEMPAYVYNTQE